MNDNSKEITDIDHTEISISEQMEKILDAEEKWSRAKVLMDILYEEMGLKDTTDSKALGRAIKQRHDDFLKAQKDFADIRKMGNIDPNEDQGRARKRQEREAN